MGGTEGDIQALEVLPGHELAVEVVATENLDAHLPAVLLGCDLFQFSSQLVCQGPLIGGDDEPDQGPGARLCRAHLLADLAGLAGDERAGGIAKALRGQSSLRALGATAPARVGLPGRDKAVEVSCQPSSISCLGLLAKSAGQIHPGPDPFRKVQDEPVLPQDPGLEPALGR